MPLSDQQSQAALGAHIEGARFLQGADKGYWELEALAWPHALFTVTARDGSAFLLRLDCAGYPDSAPTGTFWDKEAGAPLRAAQWPRAGPRVGQSLRTDWQGGTALYIPCDRLSIVGHDNWRSLYPAWLWDSVVGIAKYLELIHNLINGADYVAPAA
jgi:hypothetical protein